MTEVAGAGDALNGTRLCAPLGGSAGIHFGIRLGVLALQWITG